MEFFHLAHHHALYVLTPLLVGVGLYRFYRYQHATYTYPLTTQLAPHARNYAWIDRALTGLRSAVLAGLIIACAQPEWVQRTSNIFGQGRDIILTLDVSGSMQVFDDLRDRSSRIDVAKREAISFIHKRDQDPIGIVIFGREAISLSPLTLDKQMLTRTIEQLKLGFINEEGTALGTGIATAVNRLRHAPATSKIIILLTDGEPTGESDRVSWQMAVQLAREFDIKIYAVGIGNRRGGFVDQGFFGIQRVPNGVNERLLQQIAAQTGGQYFRAQSPDDMRKIYDEIDRLETTEYETHYVQSYQQALFPAFWLLVFLLLAELVARLFIFKGVL